MIYGIMEEVDLVRVLFLLQNDDQRIPEISQGSIKVLADIIHWNHLNCKLQIITAA